MSPYGTEVALVEIKSGHNEVETASRIAFTTLALDIHDAGDNAAKIMKYWQHAIGLLHLLKAYKDKGMITNEQWKSNSTIVHRISTMDPEQEKWLALVLSHPVLGIARLATSTFDYSKFEIALGS